MGCNLRHMHYKALISHVYTVRTCIHTYTNVTVGWDTLNLTEWAWNNQRATVTFPITFNVSRPGSRCRTKWIYLLQWNVIGALRTYNCSRQLINWYHRSIATFEFPILRVLLITTSTTSISLSVSPTAIFWWFPRNFYRNAPTLSVIFSRV